MAVQLDNLEPSAPFETYLEKRPISSYPESVMKELRLIGINDSRNTTPFGSYTYRFQRYPGDIDGIEETALCCSEEEAAEQYAGAIQRVVQDILSRDLHYFSEIKAGINPIYNFSVGEIDRGKYTPNPNLEKITLDLCERGLFPDSEIIFNVLDRISTYPSGVGTGDDYDIVEQIYRKYRILRWSADEILKGKKVLEDGSVLSLVNAIRMKTMTKIDEIALINGVFIEITNNWRLAWFDKKGTYTIFDEKHGLPSDLIKEVEKLYFSNMFYSPFKMVKRIYSYCRYKYINTQGNQWKKYIQMIAPLLQSDISAAYQIKSELDTLITLLELKGRPPLAEIDNQLDNTKQKLASILTIKESVLPELNKLINVTMKTTKISDKISLIKHGSDKLKFMINYHTIEYLKKVGLNPPPLDLLPPKLKYKFLVRKPTDAPVDLIKREMEIIKSEAPSKMQGSGFSLYHPLGWNRNMGFMPRANGSGFHPLGLFHNMGYEPRHRKSHGGCQTCGGDLTYGGTCVGCEDNPQVRLARLIKRIY